MLSILMNNQVIEECVIMSNNKKKKRRRCGNQANVQTNRDFENDCDENVALNHPIQFSTPPRGSKTMKSRINTNENAPLKDITNHFSLPIIDSKFQTSSDIDYPINDEMNLNDQPVNKEISQLSRISPCQDKDKKVAKTSNIRPLAPKTKLSKNDKKNRPKNRKFKTTKKIQRNLKKEDKRKENDENRDKVDDESEFETKKTDDDDLNVKLEGFSFYDSKEEEDQISDSINLSSHSTISHNLSSHHLSPNLSTTHNNKMKSLSKYFLRSLSFQPSLEPIYEINDDDKMNDKMNDNMVVNEVYCMISRPISQFLYPPKHLMNKEWFLNSASYEISSFLKFLKNDQNDQESCSKYHLSIETHPIPPKNKVFI